MRPKLFLLLLLFFLPSCGQQVTVTVDTSVTLGKANEGLAGVTWNGGNVELLAPFTPASVRFGGRLDEVSPSPDVIDVSGLVAKALRVRTMGSEPIITLSHTPLWLATVPPPDCYEDRRDVPCSPTAMAPTDFVVWENLIHDIVLQLVLSPAHVRSFEVWNEPNNTRSWADTDANFLLTAAASHRAVLRVQEETGFLLSLGGPATGEVSSIISSYWSLVAPDFVSWHHYTRDPLDYTEDANAVRSMTSQSEALVVSEWNHYGRKDDTRATAAGAAFVAASLIEMEQAGISRANFYRGVSSGSDDDAAGLVLADGTRRPSWWVFDAWKRIKGQRVLVGDSSDKVWTRAVQSSGRLDVLVAVPLDGDTASYSVELNVKGCAPTDGQVRVLDASNPTLSNTMPASNRVVLTSPAVAWATYSCGSK